MFLDHTPTPGRTPPNEWSVCRRGHCVHNAQQTQETNIQSLSGIRTRNPSNHTTADLRVSVYRHHTFHVQPSVFKWQCVSSTLQSHECTVLARTWGLQPAARLVVLCGPRPHVLSMYILYKLRNNLCGSVYHLFFRVLPANLPTITCVAL
jgi:hypothetical protein